MSSTPKGNAPDLSWPSAECRDGAEVGTVIRMARLRGLSHVPVVRQYLALIGPGLAPETRPRRVQPSPEDAVGAKHPALAVVAQLKFRHFNDLGTRIVVAMDALAVYVNANNPIAKLGLEQVDAIFSRDRKAGYGRALDTWGELGLTLEWATRAIQPYGRDENSGTRAFFREHVLKQGEYKAIVKEVPDQFALVEAAAMDASAIAYGPVQHALRMVKAVPIVDFHGIDPILPTVENILNGKYPLARFLYLYVNVRPGQATDPIIKEFIRFVLSRQGQSDVANFGAIPLPADLAGLNLGKLK